MLSELESDVFEIHLPLTYEHIENGTKLDEPVFFELVSFILGYCTEICDLRVTLLIGDQELDRIRRILIDIKEMMNQKIFPSEDKSQSQNLVLLAAIVLLSERNSGSALGLHQFKSIWNEINALLNSQSEINMQESSSAWSENTRFKANYDLLLTQDDDQDNVYAAFLNVGYGEAERFPELSSLIDRVNGFIDLQQNLIKMFRANLLNHLDNPGTTDFYLGETKLFNDVLIVSEYSPHKIVGDFELDELSNFLLGQGSEIKKILIKLISEKLLSEELGEVCFYVLDHLVDIDIEID